MISVEREMWEESPIFWNQWIFHLKVTTEKPGESTRKKLTSQNWLSVLSTGGELVLMSTSVGNNWNREL